MENTDKIDNSLSNNQQFRPPKNSYLVLGTSEDKNITATEFSGIAMAILGSNPNAKIQYWLKIQS